jgi:hypothetical protein
MVDLMQVPPTRSLQQRREALERANEIRTRRAALKKQLKTRQTTLVDVLVVPPAWLLSMKIGDLLLAVPKVGVVKRNKILRDIGIAPSKTVGGMSNRQRAELLARLRR